MRISGVEARNSLGIGEALHGPLGRPFRKEKHDHPNIPRDIMPRLTTKAMIDTMNEDGIVPSLLVFGVIPRFPVIATDLPMQNKRTEALATARAGMGAMVAQNRILTALKQCDIGCR